jgi:hypothetical protein
MKPLLLKNIERIVWLTTIVVVILLFKRCNDNKGAQLAAIKKQSDSLHARHIQDSLDRLASVSRWQDSIYRAGVNSDLQAKVIQQTESMLKASQNKIAQLIKIIRADHGPVDSSFVLVSPAYKDACDSLPSKIDSQNVAIAALKDQNDALNELFNYEIIYRDSLIESANEEHIKLNRQYNEQRALFNQAMKAGKPRGKVLAGAGVIGNQVNPLSGAKIAIGYQTKGGKQYQVGGVLIGGTVYYEGTVLIQVFK